MITPTPQPQTFESMLEEWQEAKHAASVWAKRERELRTALFNGAFPNPKEGTNTYELADGRKVKGVHKINRTIKEPLELWNALQAAGVNDMQKYMRVKADLRVGDYKKAEDNHRAILDQYVESKDGLPELKVE